MAEDGRAGEEEHRFDVWKRRRILVNRLFFKTISSTHFNKYHIVYIPNSSSHIYIDINTLDKPLCFLTSSPSLPRMSLSADISPFLECLSFSFCVFLHSISRLSLVTWLYLSICRMSFSDYLETFDDIESCYLVGPNTKWRGTERRCQCKKPNRSGGEHWPLLLKNPQVLQANIYYWYKHTPTYTTGTNIHLHILLAQTYTYIYYWYKHTPTYTTGTNIHLHILLVKTYTYIYYW